MGRIRLNSREETLQFGQEMAKKHPKGVFALSGNLGAGKTTFVQGLALGLGIEESVTSPTFVYLQIYDGLYHFDLYRMKSGDDFIKLGFNEYFNTGICAIEWPEKIDAILPANTIRIAFEYSNLHRTAII